MKHKLPLGFLFSSAVLLLALHVAGLYFYFYWRVIGYDRFVHILGAFWVAFVVLWAIGTKYSLSKKSIFIIGILASLIIGIGWEVFETYSGFTNIHDAGFMYDSVADIISDIIGGLIASGYFIINYQMNERVVEHNH